MNLKDSWNALDLEKPLNKVEFHRRKITSKHPVQRLKRAYLISVVFSIVFLFSFIALLFRFEEPLVRLGIATMILAYIVFSFINLKAYRKIRIDFPMDDSLKTVLLNTHEFIMGNIRYQERVGLFAYPFALSAGYLMGLSAATGNATGEMNSKIVLIALGVVIVVMTPLCWLAARWMYRISYGRCLKDLKSLIDELSATESGISDH
jgi:hypothetical protein